MAKEDEPLESAPEPLSASEAREQEAKEWDAAQAAKAEEGSEPPEIPAFPAKAEETPEETALPVTKAPQSPAEPAEEEPTAIPEPPEPQASEGQSLRERFSDWVAGGKEGPRPGRAMKGYGDRERDLPPADVPEPIEPSPEIGEALESSASDDAMAGFARSREETAKPSEETRSWEPDEKERPEDYSEALPAGKEPEGEVQPLAAGEAKEGTEAQASTPDMDALAKAITEGNALMSKVLENTTKLVEGVSTAVTTLSAIQEAIEQMKPNILT